MLNTMDRGIGLLNIYTETFIKKRFYNKLTIIVIIHIIYFNIYYHLSLDL